MMGEMTRKIPSLRFPGYIDAWEQCKLNEYLVVSKVKNKDESFGKEDVLSVSGDYGVVNQIEFQGRSFAGVSVAPYGVVETGDVIYTKSPLKANPYGIIKTNKGKAGIVSTLYAVYKPKENVCPEFIQTYFEQDARMNNYMHPLVNKGAKNDMKVSDENALKGDVIFPSKPEQIRICAFFDKLDNLIALHQRKLDEVKKLKKYMLQKMFPKDGEQLPEIRFPGFTDVWEQRKLDELASFSKGSGYSKGDLKDSGTPIVLYGRLYTKYETVISSVDTFAEPKKGSVYSSGGEVIVPASGETAEDISVASVVENAGVLLGGDLNVITPSKALDSPFLAISISNGKPHNDMAKMAQGKSVVHLHNSDLAKIELPYPSRDEQVCISSFFSKIDNIITLHQRKIEEIKILKKSLLQKMFV